MTKVRTKQAIGRQAFPPNTLLPGGLLAFDPSLCAFGWAYFDNTSSGYALKEAGCIKTKMEPGKGPKTQRAAERIGVLAWKVELLLKKRSDDWLHVVSECPTGGMGAVPLAQCFGLVCALTHTHGCLAEFVTPRAVKLAVTGLPDASKAEVADAVERKTGWRSKAKTRTAREAETDAVAVGLTHALSRPA